MGRVQRNRNYKTAKKILTLKNKIFEIKILQIIE